MPCPAKVLGLMSRRTDQCAAGLWYNRALMPGEKLLPYRQSVRLPVFDYSRRGAYFVTICARNMACIFGTVSTRTVVLNSIGQIINQCWLAIPAHFPAVELGRHIVMPNHVHGIVIIRVSPNGTSRGAGTKSEVNAKVGRRARHAVPLRDERVREFGTADVGSIPTIIGAFKSAAARRARVEEHAFSIWQRGYFEHVIRNEEDFRQHSEYIKSNPARWTDTAGR